MEILKIVLIILFFAVSIFMTLAVLMQSNRGGGLSGMLGGGSSGQNPFGTSAGDIMAKITRYLGIAFFAICLGFSALFNKEPVSAEKASQAIEAVESADAEKDAGMEGSMDKAKDGSEAAPASESTAPAGQENQQNSNPQ
jgi:protein translocase SecG subunit